jgi:hypothetical protein
MYRPGAFGAALAVLLSIAGSLRASANMTALDFRQAGQFTVQVPWRVGPSASSLPVVIHGFFGYTWFLQEQHDLLVRGVDVEVNGKSAYTIGFSGGEEVVRPARSGRQWWYRVLELPLDLLPRDATSVVRVRIHRKGRSTTGLPVPEMYDRLPDMRIDPAESPYPGEEAGWFRFEVYRSGQELPGFPGHYSGDTHVHTEYTHTQAEFGGPLEVYRRGAQSIGLDWATFTDHGGALDSKENLEAFNASSTHPPFGPRHGAGLDAKWNEFMTRTRQLASSPGRRFLGIIGTEADVRPPTSGAHDDYFNHLLVFGHAKAIPAEGANGVDWKIAGVPLRRGERGMSGLGDLYGEDTLRLERLLKDLACGRFGRAYGVDPVVYLAHPINKQSYFQPNPLRIGVWWRWGYDDEPDELPALYQHAPGRLRVSGFQLMNGNFAPYTEEIDPGIPYYDGVLAQGLRARPPVRTALAAGSDAHGGLNSQSGRDSVVSLSAIKYFRSADGDGFGSSRTLVECPDGMTEPAVLDGLRHGRTTVTNGPALVVGHDVDGDGHLTAGRDRLPSTREGDEVEARADVPIRVAWRSTPEFGAVEEVRLVLGRATGPTTLWTHRPGAAAGFEGAATVTVPLTELGAWSYVRAECVTRKGQDVIRKGKLMRRRERRAYTSPVWIRREV